MISFFRRALSSWLVLGLLGLVLIAFVITGVNGPGGMTSGGGERIAKAGGEGVSAAEVARQAQNTLDAARREDPTLDMSKFLSDGGFERLVEGYIGAKAIEIWGMKHGVRASDRLVDGEIASIPAFSGPTGQFDANVMRQLLAQQKISERQMREGIAGDSIRRQLLVPVSAGAYVPLSLVRPYASLLLEQRSGMVAGVPSDAIPAGPPPTDAEIDAWYRKSIAAFTIPERRVVRYAILSHDALPKTAPTEAEIDAFYKANAASYAASETRSLAQAILPDQAAAAALAAKVGGGVDFTTAARASGVSASRSEARREAFAKTSSPAVAAAAFAVSQGGVTAPVKAPLGWYVVKVEGVKASAGRSLEAVRAEIAESLAKQKADEALANLVAGIEESIDDGATFDDAIKANKLTGVTTPALLPNGAAPDQPDWKPAPELALLLRAANEIGADDDPVVQVIGAGQSYALVDVVQVVPPTPAPLAKVRDEVSRQIVARRASEKARAIAEGIAAKVRKGVSIAEAVAQAGIPLPPPQKAAARQMDLARSDRPAPPPLALLFSMREGDTKLLAGGKDAGWFVIHLDKIVAGDAATLPGLIEATRGEFGRVLGAEYADQFARAVTKDLGVARDEAAIGRLRKQLDGSAGQ